MDEPPGRFLSFFQELKRRNVYKVAVAYVVVAFVGLQAVDLLIPATTLPAWADEFLVAVAVFGFPVALVLAWAFEMTPEGVRRTSEAEPAEKEGTPAARTQSRSAMKALIGLGIAAAAVAGGWYLMGGGGETEPRAGDRSIAVLPFEALSADEDSRTFARGIHDDLLTRLYNVSGLQVISRTSVERYRDTDLALPAIAESLGVKWVVEGGVQHMGDKLQVNAQLIDPRTDTHAWAESYRRDLTARDLFALQGEITKKIAGSLEARLSPEETERVERRPTENLQAYRFYVQGRRHFRRKREREALENLQRAIELDSAYALAWAGLAAVAARGSGFATFPDTLLEVSGEQAARRALELDPGLAEAHASMGYLYTQQQNGPAALQELNRALELKPSYSQAHHWMGTLQAALGRPEEALAHQKRSVELNPLAPDAQESLSGAYLYVGEYEKGLAQARRAKQVEPGHYATISPALALMHLGRRDVLRKDGETVWFRESGVGFREEYLTFLGTRVIARLLEGDTTRARSLLEQMGPWAAPWDQALAHAALGQVDEAFVALKEIDWSDFGAGRTATLRYLWPRHLGDLRKDPRFQEVLRRVNRAWGLNPDGSLPEGAGR